MKPTTKFTTDETLALNIITLALYEALYGQLPDDLLDPVLLTVHSYAPFRDGYAFIRTAREAAKRQVQVMIEKEALQAP